MSFKVVSLDEIEKEPTVKRKTNPYMTRFEYTKLIASRVMQLQNGAEPSFPLKPGMRLSDVAEAEVRARTVPLLVSRTLPDGSYEDWKVTELEMIGLD